MTPVISPKVLPVTVAFHLSRDLRESNAHRRRKAAKAYAANDRGYKGGLAAGGTLDSRDSSIHAGPTRACRVLTGCGGLLISHADRLRRHATLSSLTATGFVVPRPRQTVPAVS